MKYRAKITAIQTWVEDHYDQSTHPIVRDLGDLFIEVDSAEEASDLETLNNLRIAERRKKCKIITAYLKYR